MIAHRIEEFERFIAESRVLLATSAVDGPPPAQVSTRELRSRYAAAEEELVARFQRFVDEARPLATTEALRYLEWFEPHARRIVAGSLTADLLNVAGYRRAETSYTRLAGWALGAANPSPLAQAVQTALMTRLRPGRPCELPMRVLVELSTPCGIPDLVLVGKDLLVVIEAKTLTREHEAADTGLWQTEAYLDGARTALGTSPEVDSLTVLLSMSGDAPRSATAVSLTFAAVAVAILEAIEQVDAPADEKYPYRAIATHWLEHAVPMVDVRELASNMVGYRSWTTEDVLDRLAEVLALQTAIPAPRETE